MTALLEQITSRSLDHNPLAIRPRLLSRFESKATAPAALGLEEPVEDIASFEPSSNVSSQTHQLNSPPTSTEQSTSQPFRFDSIAAKPDIESRASAPAQSLLAATPVPIISRSNSNHDHTNALSERLDELDQRLRSISATPSDRTREEFGPTSSLTSEVVEHTTLSESHHHHQHASIHTHAPSIVAENQSSKPDAPAKLVDRLQQIDRQVVQPVPIAPPQISVAHNVVTSPAKAQPRSERPLAVPKIVVENTVSSDANRTVNVTIGRIEVRATHQPSAPSSVKPSQPGPKIMSLDDYMRRRAGGSG